jgi:hypothetical protein
MKEAITTTIILDFGIERYNTENPNIRRILE